jgi:NitT/TauT family transport system substrate-binding protein
MQRFHVTATGHSLNYLPEYVAAWKGWFADAGIDYSAEVPRPWDLVLDQLANGSADAALGGIWVPSMYYGREQRYVPFAQLANRAPLALVGRPQDGDFELGNLRGKTVLMKGSNGASVGLFLKMLLTENNIDSKEVNYIQDLDGKMLSTLFVGGMGDYLLIDYPSALQLCTDTDNIVADVFCVDGNVIPWSVYYTRGVVDDDMLQIQRKVSQALARAMDWINDNSAESYIDFLEKTFPALSRDVLITVTDVYRANEMWTVPAISKEGYERWQKGICQGFLTDAEIPYDTLVDSRAAGDIA